jgi:hypothetical protein
MERSSELFIRNSLFFLVHAKSKFFRKDFWSKAY